MSYGVGHRWGSDLALLWLWRTPAATAPIEPLAWEPPYAEGVALKRQKKKKKVYLFKEVYKKTNKKNYQPIRKEQQNII